MSVDILNDILQLKSLGVFDLLLKDKTTGENIIWATDAYRNKGREYARDRQILPELTGVIMSRAQKAKEAQTERTRQHAEVFTPLWICDKMTAYAEQEAQKATPLKYIDAKKLEITCGEAPFLVSRYDAATGEAIPIEKRIGLLDRKLQLINRTAGDEQEWMQLARRAYEATYGYEFQGDNLLIARINLIATLREYKLQRWGHEPDIKEYKTFIKVIVYNLWQMDGLTGTLPYNEAQPETEQLDLFSLIEPAETPKDNPAPKPPCKIYDWRSQHRHEFRKLREGKHAMKFDFIIGNPPYQEDSIGANESDTPLYHYFYEQAFELADKVELISPARFLFNAGYTPKAWNEKMLNDECLKVLYYEPKSSKVFVNTDIKGGIVITYHDISKKFGAIKVFTVHPELNNICTKVWKISKESLSKVVTNRGLYRYSDLAYQERPNELAKTADARIAPSAFERMPSLFTDKKPNDDHEYVQIFGNIGSERFYKWFRRDYVKSTENIDKFKVLVPKANGNGEFGETLSSPLVAKPCIGFTETYISIGETDSFDEANSILKYIKTKFARTMLAVLKVTQNNAKPCWEKVPLQNFTSNSDIDWSQSIADIDQQLYRKYGLTAEEADFIETHVKEME